MDCGARKVETTEKTDYLGGQEDAVIQLLIGRDVDTSRVPLFVHLGDVARVRVITRTHARGTRQRRFMCEPLLLKP